VPGAVAVPGAQPPVQSLDPAPAPASVPQPQQAQPPLQGPLLQTPLQPAPAAPTPAPVLPLSGPQPDPVPVAVDLLSKLAKHRHRRPLNDPDEVPPGGVAEEPAGAADNPTRGVGWLPRPDADAAEPQEAGPEAWFAAKVVPDPVADPAPDDRPDQARAAEPAAVSTEATVEQYLEGLRSFIDTYNYEPDEHKLAEHLFTAHGVTGKSGDRPVSVETLRRHWPELQQRFAERYE
jgi:hypothetical protein